MFQRQPRSLLCAVCASPHACTTAGLCAEQSVLGWCHPVSHGLACAHGCRRVVEYIGAGCTDNSSEDTRRQSMFLVQGERLPGVWKGA